MLTDKEVMIRVQEKYFPTNDKKHHEYMEKNKNNYFEVIGKYTENFKNRMYLVHEEWTVIEEVTVHTWTVKSLYGTYRLTEVVISENTSRIYIGEIF
jgi:Tat protein secretion system quality control protein TatD with DNase activity